ncbi:MAG: class I SAM-dependent methyltransferase [Sneathiella sp.]
MLVNIKYRGLLMTCLGLLANICAKIKIPLLQNYRFNQQNLRESGLDTAGIVETAMLDIPDEFRASACRYEAASDYEFRHVLERLHIDYSDYHFIDYGSGKGAILASAARYPFKSVTGIEISGALHQTAMQNIAEIQRQGKICANSLTSVHSDAASYSLSAAPHVIYVYNSFGADVMQKVLDRISADLRGVQAPVYFLYNNPMHHQVLEESPEFHRMSKAFGGKWLTFIRPGNSSEFRKTG